MLHHSSRLLANKFVCCLLLRRADSCELACSGQGSMTSDSTENGCLRIDASGAENIIDGRLHMPALCLPARCWCAHGAIGVQRPWISCCGEVGKNRESVGDSSGGGGGGNGGGGGGSGGIGLEVEETKFLFLKVRAIPYLPLVHRRHQQRRNQRFGASQKEVADAAREKESQSSRTRKSPARRLRLRH